MASIVQVTITDDLDGSPNAETVTFGLDGVSYEIDLTQKNREKLVRTMGPYLEAARKVGSARSRTGTTRRSAARVDRAAVRAWASDNGLKVSERGRISAAVLEQYEATH
jgi:hypothetical protein